MNTRILNYIYLLLFLVSCSAGNGIYQSSYPSYLKNRSTKQISAQSQSKLTSTAETSENSQQSEYKESEIQNPNVIQDSINTYDYPESFESVQTPEASQYLSNSPIENNELNNIITLETYQSDCPTINDLTCQYLGDGVYMLTWSVPKIPIYTENGTLSEYRINRKTLEDQKAFVYKTPEPECVEGKCTIIFNNLGNRTGYIWTVDTRCSRTNFTSSNSVSCEPKSQNASTSENPTTETNETPYIKPVKNNKALWSFLLVPILAILGILTLTIIPFFGFFTYFSFLFIIFLGCILSIYLGIKALKEIKADEKHQKGKGRAVLGIIGSVIGIILTVFFSNVLAFL
jgi:hypothetical protein